LPSRHRYLRRSWTTQAGSPAAPGMQALHAPAERSWIWARARRLAARAMRASSGGGAKVRAAANQARRDSGARGIPCVRLGRMTSRWAPREANQSATAAGASPVAPGPSSTTTASPPAASRARQCAAGAAVAMMRRLPGPPRGRIATPAGACSAAATAAERLVPMLRTPMTRAWRTRARPASRAYAAAAAA